MDVETLCLSYLGMKIVAVYSYLSGGARSDVRHHAAMPRVVGTVAKESGFYAAVVFFLVLAAFPFYWMLITSLETNPDLYNVEHIPFWFNEPPTQEHFRYLLQHTMFLCWLLNSLIIGVCVVAITLMTALPAGYIYPDDAGIRPRVDVYLCIVEKADHAGCGD